MAEPRDIELIDYLAGRGTEARRCEIEAELARSPQLQRRLDELAKIWDLLGEADVELPRRDLYPHVAAAEQARRAHLPWWARAAAAIVLAAVGGHVAGRVHLRITPSEPDPEPVTASTVADDLHLDAFGTTGVYAFAQDLLSGRDEDEGNTQ